MQERIRGIVLRTVKYGDSGLIVDMFTEQYGRKSFATKVVKGRRTASNSALWTPLSMVEFETTIRPNGKLPRPKDVGIYYNNVGLMFNPVKSTIALFLSEFLCHALKSETDNVPLYAYLEHSIRWLDASERTFANFHLVFLMRLTRFLGIYPN
ncbi:MAG: recombination protein O N-terminal domain-containing protein, partial [Bacteroidaceae bacterium]|nr:recombination protein O N-terminal domain-containing protein [Bacteroidaceae bacterium]